MLDRENFSSKKAYAKFIISDGAVQLTAAVSDEKFVSGRFAGTRLSALIFLVQNASHALAGFTRDPQVGRASVEDDLETLAGCTDGDLAIVLGILVVVQAFAVFFRRVTREEGEFLAVFDIDVVFVSSILNQVSPD